MARCDVCGNDYERAFQLKLDGHTYTFDSFECAISKLAPHCAHCDCRILGHGLQAGDRYFCCAHCARASGQTALVDHA